MDLVDLAAAFSSLPLPRGKRIALMTLGGGWGVVATDMCIQTGLTVPRLTPDIIARLDTVLPPYWSKENPVDLVGELAATTPIQVLEALAAWEGCDAVIHLGVVGRLHLVCSMLQAVRASGQAIDPAYAEQGLAMYRQAEQDFFACAAKFMERYRKPILGVFLDDRKSRTLTDIPGSPYKGVAFLTPERAVRALASMATYYGWRKDHEAEK
jgi:acyl-CoA synthetase (NDP forming)